MRLPSPQLVVPPAPISAVLVPLFRNLPSRVRSAIFAKYAQNIQIIANLPLRGARIFIVAVVINKLDIYSPLLKLAFRRLSALLAQGLFILNLILLLFYPQARPFRS